MKKGVAGMASNTERRTVSLPYDAQIFERRNSAFPHASGSFPVGKWEYRKTFFIPAEWKGQSISFLFEGVYQRALVYINHDLAANHAYGYTPFLISGEKYIRYGEENEITVLVHLADGARWYSGTGIYRDVYLLTGGPVCVAPYGLKTTTEYCNASEASIVVDTAITNRNGEPKETVYAVLEIKDPSGNAVAKSRSPVTVVLGETEHYRQRLYIRTPALWGTETPSRYTVRVTLAASNQSILDTATEEFGIRAFMLDPENGLRMNGEPIKLRGAAVHHDNGPVGAVSTDFIEERRLKKLKEAGFNAVRTAHNPPSPAFLRVCDRLGLLVMLEAFDTWSMEKVDFDYTMDFEKCWKEDIRAIVDMAYNHPSVLMYSIGNEIADTGSALGSRRGRRIVDYIRSLDGSRYIINAINGMVSVMGIIEKLRDDSQKQADQDGQNAINHMMHSLADTMKEIMRLDAVTCLTEEAFACVDIGGYNYMDIRYHDDARRFPNRIMCGTETFVPDIDAVWERVMTNSHVIGDFCWTGWDYMGEPSTGLIKYEAPPMEYGMGLPFPALTSAVGEFSICGYRQPQSYYHEIVLKRRREPYISVLSPGNYGKTPYVTPWSWFDGTASWAWDGYEGRPTRVEVYSDAGAVELFINGRSLGVQEPQRLKAVFDVVYEPGEIRAVNIRNGRQAEAFALKSADGGGHIVIRPELPAVSLDKGEFIYLPITAEGRNEVTLVTRRDAVSLTVEGCAELIGFATDDPLPEEDICDRKRSLYQGRALAVLRPVSAGTVRITAASEELGSAYAEILVE